MNILKLIPIALAFTLFLGCAGTEVEPVPESDIEIQEQVELVPESDINKEEDPSQLYDEKAIYGLEEELVESQDINLSTYQRSDFEKSFVYHSAYLFYSKGIEELYSGNYKNAYDYAMRARAIYENDKADYIPLPYMPSYVRESAYTPKRIYYKMINYKQYELNRLITKIKLLSPPIPTVVFNRTSTYIDVTIRNFGDLPLDRFEVFLNDEKIALYEKILPHEEKIVRVESAPKLYEISFKEKYGFAPNSIMLSED